MAVWTFAVFLSAADCEFNVAIFSKLTPQWISIITVMMIIRVYAMWNKSRTVLRVLLSIYVVQTILSVVVVGVYIHPVTYLSGMSRARLVVSMESKAYLLPSPTTSFSSDNCPNSGFLVLQYLMERPTQPHDIFYNSQIYSWCCAIDSRSHANLEAVS